MKLVDSRRLPGPNLLWPRPGAVLDLEVSQEEAGGLILAWERQARCILDAVGWVNEQTCVRRFEGGASLALSAPLDALYAATEVNEWALESALAGLGGGEVEESAVAAERLRGLISEESNPRLLALQAAAQSHKLAFLSDDDWVSVGLGQGCQGWAVDALPAPADVDWSACHDIPLALITGTNGKTTTVRLLAAMARAAGLKPGFSSTDQVVVGDEVVEQGDWSGPGGARRVLRHPATDVALLETARGGMLRRGLAVERADVAAVLNVGADHLGEWGIGSLSALCEGKFVVTSVAPHLVLNADDEQVVSRARSLSKPTTWFSLNPLTPWLSQHVAGGGCAWVLDTDSITRRQGTETIEVLALNQMPLAAGGAARHNVSNALAAAAVAEALGIDQDSIAAGLRSFRGDDSDNPGRMNCFDLGGVQAIVDFAHNPHGLEAMLLMSKGLRSEGPQGPQGRLLVLLGQAGDRDDDAIRELARLTAGAYPDRVILKHMDGYNRGREEGAVVSMLAEELVGAGLAARAMEEAPSELEALERALAWARPGDQLLLLAHTHRTEVLDRVRSLRDGGWQPGEQLPASLPVAGS